MKTSFYKKPTLILVDDHLIFRQGLKALITTENLGIVIGEASDGNEFLKLLELPAPDLVIMDIDMPNLNGMEATEKALAKFPNLKIIVFSMFGDEEYLKKMTQLGVKGYIIKSSGISEVEQAMVDVMNGKNYFSKDLPKIGINKPTKTISPSMQNTQLPWWSLLVVKV